MRSKRVTILYARAAGPRRLTVMACTNAGTCNIFHIKLYGLKILTRNYLPRVGGTCCFDGVDPELVGDISKSLQGFLIGFVVVSHDVWTDLKMRQTEGMLSARSANSDSSKCRAVDAASRRPSP